MARGDHVFVWRRTTGVIPYQHHAIDVGQGQYIHFTDGQGGTAGPFGRTQWFSIQRTTDDVLTRSGRDRIHIIDHADRLPVEEVVRRAESRIGQSGYHLLFHNCEHFATWCVTGVSGSRQVQAAQERATAVGTKTALVQSIRYGAKRMGSKIATKSLCRGATPWLVVADAAQWTTEAAGHHLGLTDPRQRRHVARAIGATTAMGIGLAAGPVGMLVAGTVWATGEIASMAAESGSQRA